MRTQLRSRQNTDNGRLTPLRLCIAVETGATNSRQRCDQSHLIRPLESAAHHGYTPFVIPIIGSSKPMARSGIHELVKSVFHASAARLRLQGPEFEAAAVHIEQASTHWMRHTAGNHLSEKSDLKVVRDNLAHANITTTSIYLHSEEDARHDATAAVHRVGWATQ